MPTPPRTRAIALQVTRGKLGSLRSSRRQIVLDLAELLITYGSYRPTTQRGRNLMLFLNRPAMER